jgi:hypothetical protein
MNADTSRNRQKPVRIEKTIVEEEAETCFLNKRKKVWDEQGWSKGAAIKARVLGLRVF